MIHQTDINFTYLKDLEAKYDISLNEIISSDPILYTVLHERDFINVPSNEIKLKWVELVTKKVEKILNDFQPDIILTIGNNYFVKNITYHISKNKKILFLSILNARIADKYVAFDNLGINTPDFILKKMKSIGSKNLDEAKDIINYLNKDALTLYKSHNYIIDSISSENLLKGLVAFFKRSLVSLYLKLFVQTDFNKNYLGISFLKGLIYEFRNNIYRKNILKKSSVFSKSFPIMKNYYYMALHVIPESATLTQSDDYNEEAHIIDISRKLPIDTYLVVKENIEMLGIRPLSFYKRLNKIHNVILVNPFMSSMDLIKNSHGVISICGTVTLEAALLNKRAICIGTPEYSDLKGVERYDKNKTSFTLNTKIDNNSEDNLSYIQTIIDIGESVDVHFLMGDRGKLEYESKKFKNGVTSLKKIFDKSRAILSLEEYQSH